MKGDEPVSHVVVRPKFHLARNHSILKFLVISLFHNLTPSTMASQQL